MFPNCHKSKFRNDLPNVAINNSIQADESFDILSQFPDFCVPDISKYNKVRNLRQTPKVSLFTNRLVDNVLTCIHLYIYIYIYKKISFDVCTKDLNFSQSNQI